MNLTFITGTGRCGSTLIHEILSKHENVGFISNIEDNIPLLNLKGRFNNYLFRSPLGRLTRKGTLRLAPSEAYNLIHQQVSPIYSVSCRDLRASDVTPRLERQFQHFFQQRAAQQQKSLFLHKYTGWSRIGFFSKIFPESRFIHIVRDGRAVANSWLQMDWWDGYKGPESWLWGSLPVNYNAEWVESNKSFVKLAGIGWKLLLDSYEQSSSLLPADKYLEIRYEDFLATPREILQNIFHFCGLHWTKEFEKHFNKQRIMTERRHAFMNDLSQDQLKELQDTIKNKLIYYGYSLNGPNYTSERHPASSIRALS